MKRLLWVVAIIAAVGVAGWLLYTQVLIPRRTEAEVPSYETVVVDRGAIASSVSATGSIEPEAEVSLAFRTPGVVDDVMAVAGQQVNADQLLAELETTDLTLALAQSNAGLEITEAQLAKLLEPPRIEDLLAAQAAIEVAQTGVASAEAALRSAQAAYRELLSGPSEAEQKVNLAQVFQAEANVKTAQQAYNEVKNLSNVGALPQAAELERATIALDVARTQAELATEPPDEAQIAAALNQIAQAEGSIHQAKSNLITAQNNLRTLLEGANEQDIRVAEAQQRQGQLSVLQAQNSLANAQLTAPFAGIISRVNIHRGEQAAAGTPAMVLTDLERFHMQVLVDEIDVRQIAIGQPVQIRVDALPEAEITGLVTEVAPTAQDVGGVIAYEVTVVPDPMDAPLRAGMSATAIVTTAEVDDVLLVPNRYIQRDRDTGRAFVNKMVGDEPVLQEVELGLRNDRVSQILAGLTDGDELALVTRSSEERLRGALFGGE